MRTTIYIYIYIYVERERERDTYPGVRRGGRVDRRARAEVGAAPGGRHNNNNDNHINNNDNDNPNYNSHIHINHIDHNNHNDCYTLCNNTYERNIVAISISIVKTLREAASLPLVGLTVVHAPIIMQWSDNDDNVNIYIYIYIIINIIYIYIEREREI